MTVVRSLLLALLAGIGWASPPPGPPSPAPSGAGSASAAVTEAGPPASPREAPPRSAATAREGEPLADRLLQLFLRRLSDEPESEDVGLVAAELERTRAAGRPGVRIRQSSSWPFDLGGRVGLGVTLTVPLSDPEGTAQEDLLRWRLELALHNAHSERARQAHEFRRTLRLLAHLEEVVFVLDAYRPRLAESLPEPPSLAAASPPPELDSRQIAFLEMEQGLQRARGELALLQELVALRTGLEVELLRSGRVGRPAGPAGPASESACLAGTDDSRRAELVLRQAEASTAAARARQEARVTLDLGGDVSYRFAPRGAGEQWQADLRLSLQASLPPVGGASPGLTLDGRSTGIDQQLTFDWPGPAASPVEPEDAAARRYRRSVEESRLAVSQAAAARDVAAARVALRRAVLVGMRAPLDPYAPPADGGEPHELKASSQARLALLNAELELDLAEIDLAEACGVRSQALTSATSRLSPSMRSTIPSRSAWSSSNLSSSLRTKRV
jgi:hypothetical protein